MKPRKHLAAEPPPRIFLCAGLKSSGSTWLFNAAVQILREARRSAGAKASKTDIAAIYADNLGMFPADVEYARSIVVKCHVPSPAIRFLTRALRGKTLITVREPRDAITSLMQRFGHSFAGSLSDVTEQAAQMVELAKNSNVLLLKYEDRFFDMPDTIGTIAKFLGVRISSSSRDRIYRSLRRETVQKKIDKLQAKGAFGEIPAPDAFDPETHWHPGHVGDSQIGKFSAVLTPEQQKSVVDATGPYLKAFCYADPPRHTHENRVRRPKKD